MDLMDVELNLGFIPKLKPALHNKQRTLPRSRILLCLERCLTCSNRCKWCCKEAPNATQKRCSNRCLIRPKLRDMCYSNALHRKCYFNLDTTFILRKSNLRHYTFWFLKVEKKAWNPFMWDLHATHYYTSYFIVFCIKSRDFSETCGSGFTLVTTWTKTYHQEIIEPAWMALSSNY